MIHHSFMELSNPAIKSSEYKEVFDEERQVRLDLLRYYQRIPTEGLHPIQLGQMEEISKSLRNWLIDHPLTPVQARILQIDSGRGLDLRTKDRFALSMLEKIYRDEGLLQELVWLYRKAGLFDRAESAQKHLIQLLSKGEIQSKTQIGRGRPFLVTFEGGIQAIFKTITEENVFGEKTTPSEYDYPRGWKEILAFDFDQYFGLNVVPTTVFREIDGQKGSVQYFVKNARSVEDLDHLSGFHGQGILPHLSSKILFLDYLILNIDRNEENVLLRRGGQQVAIDNENSFFTNNYGDPGLFRDFGRRNSSISMLEMEHRIKLHPKNYHLNENTIHLLSLLDQDRMKEMVENVFLPFGNSVMEEEEFDDLFRRRDQLIQFGMNGLIQDLLEKIEIPNE